MAGTMKMQFGEFLKQRKIITDNELQAALIKQKQVKGSVQNSQLGNVFLSQQILKKDILCKELTAFCGNKYTYIPILDYVIKADITNICSLDLMIKLKTIPISIDHHKKRIELATVSVIPAEREQALSVYQNKQQGYEIKMYDVMEYSYTNILNQISRLATNRDLEREIEATPEELLQGVYRAAVRARASDIHIYPTTDRIMITFEVARKLYSFTAIKLPYSIKDNIVRSVLAHADKVTTATNDGVVDATIKDLLKDDTHQARINITEIVTGMSITYRIIDKMNDINNLDVLKLSQNVTRALRATIKKRGLILITGYMGSGKTSTIYGALSELNDGTRHIVTVEDPVEKHIYGICQTSLNKKMTFASFARSVVRQACHVMMVGEIRDAESLDVTTQGALAGMTTISTLHVKTLPEAFDRIESLQGNTGSVSVGLSPQIVRTLTALEGIFHQMMVSKLCPKCRQKVTIEQLTESEQYVIKKIGYKGNMYKAIGCSDCYGWGYKGATVIAEFVEFTTDLRVALKRLNSTQELDAYLRKYMEVRQTAMLFDGLRHLNNGDVDVITLISEQILR